MNAHPDLIRFIRESNAIEGIHGDPTAVALDATAEFLSLPALDVIAVENLVDVYQPGARLRLTPGQNVRVGQHIAPAGGPEIGAALRLLLVNAPYRDPWSVHVDYETLHPFTDGNGRSGRAIWAWQMVRDHGFRALSLGFLHRFYYQTLEKAGR